MLGLKLNHVSKRGPWRILILFYKDDLNHLRIDILNIPCEIDLGCVLKNSVSDKSPLVTVLAWCTWRHQAITWDSVDPMYVAKLRY